MEPEELPRPKGVVRPDGAASADDPALAQHGVQPRRGQPRQAGDEVVAHRRPRAVVRGAQPDGVEAVPLGQRRDGGHGGSVRAGFGFR